MGTLGQFCVSLHRASGYLDPQGLWHYYQKWKKCGIFGTWLYSEWHFFEGQNCSLGRWFGLSGRVVKNRTVFFGGIWNDCLIFLVRERGRERERMIPLSMSLQTVSPPRKLCSLYCQKLLLSITSPFRPYLGLCVNLQVLFICFYSKYVSYHIIFSQKNLLVFSS